MLVKDGQEVAELELDKETVLVDENDAALDEEIEGVLETGGRQSGPIQKFP